MALVAGSKIWCTNFQKVFVRHIGVQKQNADAQMGEQVISSVKKSKEFAIQLDETTDVSSNSQLMVYIRYRGSDEFEEEMLLCSPLELRTRGIDVFNKVDACFKKPNVDLKWEDCIAVSVDGAPAMLGHVNGFVALAKQQNPDILAIHCMIHRQALVVKNLEPEVEAVLMMWLRLSML
ncbi:protein FAM200C-like [Oratosquilla oratoria]|uniref:protein FAM200C-like n=1 Tax=Oratosquilla oratoria TaxID=337810 RepID=UPI003F76D5B7